MKKAVLFDFHNTLAICDSWLDLEIRTLPSLTIGELMVRGSLPAIARANVAEAEKRFKSLRQEVRASGVELSALEGTRRVLEELGYSLPLPEIASVVAYLEEDLLPQVEMVEGALDALADLRNEGYRLGVVSSAGYPQFVEMALELLGLRSFFVEVVTSAGEGIYKSDPELYLRAVRYLGVEPDEAVHVGDHPVYDVQTAKAAGLSTIWFSAHAERTAHLHSAAWSETRKVGDTADAEIDDLRALSRVVRGM